MALSAAANITGLNHTLQQLITQSALYKLEIPGKAPKTEILIVHTNYWYRKQENDNYWYRTAQNTAQFVLV